MARMPMSADDADAIARRLTPHLVQELKPMVAEAIKEAEKNLMTRLGIDHEKLADVQKDMSFVRSQRELKEAVIKQGILAVVGLLVVGIVTALGFWIRSGMPK